MDLYSGYINKLIDELSGLPGIGSKSAQRLAFHLIGLPEAKVNRIANAMIQARQNVRYCKECFTLTDNELCPICANAERDHSTIMVVENSRDLAAYEKTGKYKGVYHVLHGAISPMLGVGPHDIKLKELMERLSREPEVKEVIIAPEDQIKRVNTASGTAIAVEDGANRAVIVGQEADVNVLEDTEISQTFPVIRVPDNNTQQRVIDPRTGKYVIIE